jgi:uncharacterized protein YbbC (DUF1343 family)
VILAAAMVGVLSGPVVEVGLERLRAEHGGSLRGRRVGLLCHAASVTSDGRHAIDILRDAGVDVRRLFAPEHGLRGLAAAGQVVASGTDAATGLPVVSLYGAKTAPTPDDLRELDALVVDLQDVGVRFYTYAASMLRCLEPAVAAGVEVVVLDRPNPLGGDLLEGPRADSEAPRAPSLMSLAPGPLVNGLTLGEIARYANSRRVQPARLTVVAMRGWHRSMTWAETGRAWTPPSPNLRTAEAAMAYPGVCLLEATNVSEGRGTETPFLLFGAPWLDVKMVLGALDAPGFAFDSAVFTPRATQAAPEPKHEGVACRGVRVRVVDGPHARPYRLGVVLLARIRGQAGFAWRDEGWALDRLVGTSRLREALLRGDGVDVIVGADAPGLQSFRLDRQSSLLYD